MVKIILFSFAVSLFARNIFLNGVDVSSAKSQELKNVNVRINESGDVYIDAPHYQAKEEQRYLPLSTYVEGVNKPAHKLPRKQIQDNIKKPDDKVVVPDQPATQGP